MARLTTEQAAEIWDYAQTSARRCDADPRKVFEELLRWTVYHPQGFAAFEAMRALLLDIDRAQGRDALGRRH